MPIDKSKLTKEMLEKAAMCQNADDLVALAKIKGIEKLQRKRPRLIWMN